MLLRDADTYNLFVPVGVDFDLNGNVMTAEYVTSFGNIIDSNQKKEGLLKVSNQKILLQKSNTQLPVKDQGGYRFVGILKFNQRLYAESYKFAFQPLFEESAHQYLMQGLEASGITVGVKVSWKNDQGPRSQTFTYKDSLVQQFIQSYKGPESGEYSTRFTLVLTGAEGLDDLQYQIVIKSETGVQIAANPKLQPST